MLKRTNKRMKRVLAQTNEIAKMYRGEIEELDESIMCLLAHNDLLCTEIAMWKTPGTANSK